MSPKETERPDAPLAVIRPHVQAIPTSKIREVAVLGMGRDDVTALWFGESDMATPDFIRQAAKRALDAGHTFYTANAGIPPLRAALSKYMSDLYGRAIAEDRVIVTASGMAALMIVMQAVLEPGDNVLVTTPIWPNCREAPRIIGAEARPVQIDLGEAGWRLDLDKLFAAVDDRTRAIQINSPGNPTGWVMPTDQQREVLEFCRARGIWLIADEVYNRIIYEGPYAPTFLSLATQDDPVIVINSFSKSWCMTGWRVGWITAPARIGPEIEKLIEFNYSCPVDFVQHAAVTAVEEGDEFIAQLVERYRRARDLVYQRLAACARVRLARPEAAFYAFMAVDGMGDSTEFAKKILTEHGVGLAPGAAFGPGGEGHLRLCFASAPETLSTALDRLEVALG